MKPPITGIGYRGGKTYRNRSGVGRWIASLLPMGRAYIEPFAGFAGILLQREPSKIELLNDLDGHIVNWWLCVRDCAAEFDRRLDRSPPSEILFRRARRALDESSGFDPMGEPDLDLAVAVHIVMSQSIIRTTEAKSWAVSWKAHPTNGGIMRNQPDTERLRARLRRVQLSCRDAVSVVRRAGQNPDAVLYLDPPYTNGSSMGYRLSVDREALSDALRAVKARAAISGYDGDFDDLGWERHEFAGQTIPPNYDPSKHDRRRLEVLWTNYPAEPSGLL